MRPLLILLSIICTVGGTARAGPRLSLIERIQADLERDRAFSKTEREAYLSAFRQRLASYAFDVIKAERVAAADVLMSVVTEGSFDQQDLERTVGVAVAAYVAVRNGAPADAVEGIALYGFRKRLEPEKIAAWANGVQELAGFGVPEEVAEDLVHNAAAGDWPIEDFLAFKWALVHAVKAEHDPAAFARYLLGHYRAGKTRPGSLVAQATRAFQRAASVGELPELPPYESPVLHPELDRPEPAPPDPKVSVPPRPVPSDREGRVRKLMSSVVSFLGTPYVWGGRSRRGTDCSGLVQTTFAEIGIPLGRRVRDQWKQGRKVRRNGLARGDLVFFVTVAGRLSHVGIVTDPAKTEFVHASSSRGVVRSNLQSRYYRQRYHGARRVLPD